MSNDHDAAKAGKIPTAVPILYGATFNCAKCGAKGPVPADRVHWCYGGNTTDKAMTTAPGHGETDGVELCVLIDGEEKPISHAVAFELAKIEANTYMEFHADRHRARRACDESAQKMAEWGFPAWFVNAYRVGANKYIDHITIL